MPKPCRGVVTDGPREVIRTDKFRIVQGASGTYSVEKFEGYAAMGEERWRDLKFGEADAMSRLMRDWIFAHAACCPLLKESDDEDLGHAREQVSQAK